MVTAELAVALPALVGVVVGLAWLLSLGAAQAVVAQAAREGARAAARGDTAAQVSAAVSSVAPGARVTLRVDDRLVTVTARIDRDPPAGLPSRWARGVQASATSFREEP